MPNQQQLFNFGTSGSSSSSGNLFNTNSSNAGVVPSSGSTYTAPEGYGDESTSSWYSPWSWGSTSNPMDSTLDPTLTKNFDSWLESQVGKGATPFNLSAILPSSGGTTTPGTLTAPLTDLLSQLQSFLKTGRASDGQSWLSTLESESKTGDPIDQTAAWKAMVESMQQNISQNQANLKEQLNVGGNLVGTPYGNTMANFQEQTAKDQNAALLQAQTSALESAEGRKMTASSTLSNLQDTLGQYLQGLDQSSIEALYKEFIRTRPEYSPLLSYISTAANTPSTGSASSGVDIGGILSAAMAAML
jgi:hypothetical protein